MPSPENVVPANQPGPSDQKSENKLSFLEVIERGAKAALSIAALIYALGIVISNQYVMSLHVSDFTALKPKYIITGTWALLMLVTAGLPVLMVFSSWTALSQQPSRDKHFWPKLIVTAALGIGTSLTLNPVILGVLGGDADQVNLSIFALLTLRTCLVGVIFVAAYEVRRVTIVFTPFIQLALLLFLPTYLLMATGKQIQLIYVHVPEAMGGGKSHIGELILNKEGGAFWSHTGLVSTETKELPVSTGKSEILYQNEHVYVVRAPFDANKKGKTFILERSLVQGFIPSQ
jgi:hypothetical protein